jgi:DNA-damage-inducible protein D
LLLCAIFKTNNSFMENHKIVLFQEKQIRREWHNDEWWFSVIDIIEVLTESPRARKYWSALKTKLQLEGFDQLSPFLGQLKMTSLDGKKRETDVANTEGLFRLIMSIPSPKAEPFKLWLAQLGKERMDEIENPELAAERARNLYRAKGYSDEWIEMRLKSIEVRQQLTGEWKNRGVQEGQEYAILTAEIAQATFGVTPAEHKEIKNLKRENLRDHMTNLELIFTMLGEESTRHSAILRDAEGLAENKLAAREGGEIAGKSRQEYETRLGEKVVSSRNFKQQIQAAKGENGKFLEENG